MYISKSVYICIALVLVRGMVVVVKVVLGSFGGDGGGSIPMIMIQCVYLCMYVCMYVWESEEPE